MGWENVLDEQIALKNWWATDDALMYALSFANSVMEKHPDTAEFVRATYQGFVSKESQKLYVADPVWIAPTVCEIVRAAMEADPPFQPEPLLPTDLPAVWGYMRFDTPMLLRDGRDQLVNVAAASWAPCMTDEAREKYGTPDACPWDEQGIHMTLYSDLECVEDPGLDLLRDHRSAARMNRMVMLHQFYWAFGKSHDASNWSIGTGQDAEVAVRNMTSWFALMQITFRICQQKITSTGKTRLPRGFRRRAEREGHDPYTKLITLRRYETKKGKGHDAELDGPYYDHRFIVGGHWRAQWYPTLGPAHEPSSHRQIWIHAFIKGPPDAELIVKPNRAVEVVR